MPLTLPTSVKIWLDTSSKDAPYVAYSPELEVASCGQTPEKAKAMLEEAIEITLTEAAKDGTLEEYLELVGYGKKKGKLTPPKVSFEPFFFSLPDTLASKLQWAP